MVVPPDPGSNKADMLKQVALDQQYSINCVSTGGNPPPNVTLRSGSGVHPDVDVVVTTERDVRDVMSEPIHTKDVTLQWTPTVDDIGRHFFCSAGVQNARAVWTSFIPTVADSKSYSILVSTTTAAAAATIAQ